MSTPRRRGLPKTAVRSRIVHLLGAHPEGLCKAEFVATIRDTTEVTVQRAITELKADGAIERDTSSNRWSLVEPDYGEPIDSPQPEDLEAVLLAEALLAPVADSALRGRLRRLAEGIDDRLRRADAPKSRAQPTLARDAVAATLTFSTRVDREVLGRLLRAVRREVVQLRYHSPWDDRESVRVLEPWQIRLHDGVFYLRGWDRRARQPRTLRVVHILSVSAVPMAGPPRQPIPRASELWSQGDPAVGIDEDRPDTAVVVVRGGVARWLSAIEWAPGQHDEWLVPRQLLRRTVRYRSCREMARRVLAIADAVASIEPLALREAVLEATGRCGEALRKPKDDLPKIMQRG